MLKISSIFSAYRRYRQKRNLQRFEKSLVDLQRTIQDAIHSCKRKSDPPKT